MKRNIVLATAAFFLLFLCAGCRQTSYLQTTVSSEENEAYTDEAGQEDGSSGDIFVQVSGAVNEPGVYELADNARVYQAIDLAGGLRADASADELNQAALLSDGQRIHIPTEEEAAATAEQAAAGADSADDGKVNINTADAAELMTLSGIGEAKAQMILDYREENGAFGSIEDIMKIRGIKEGVFSQIRDSITVGY